MFINKDANFKKLITREDKFNIHKILGIICICSYIYRYGYVYLNYGNLGFGYSKNNITFNFLNILVHILLSTTSLFFRVPKKRIQSKPMIIYEEYRLHAIIFTIRCFSVYCLYILFPNLPKYFTPIVVMLHHMIADYVTYNHGTIGNTAVRSNSKNTKGFYKFLAKIYSFYQFLAIGSHILPNNRRGDLAYNSIIAIQSSAFLMTLYRKRIIKGKTHILIYSLCLILSTFHILQVLGYLSCFLILINFMLRISIPRNYNNKYILWFLFYIIHEYIL